MNCLYCDKPRRYWVLPIGSNNPFIESCEDEQCLIKAVFWFLKKIRNEGTIQANCRIIPVNPIRDKE